MSSSPQGPLPPSLLAAKPALPVPVGTLLSALGWGANGEEGVGGTDALQEVRAGAAAGGAR